MMTISISTQHIHFSNVSGEQSACRPGCSDLHVGGQQSGVCGNRALGTGHWEQGISGPAHTCWVRICNLKTKHGIPPPTNLSRTASPLWVPAKRLELPFESHFPLASEEWNTTLSVYMKQLARGRPGNNGYYYYLMNSRHCSSLHMALDCHYLPSKADKALFPWWCQTARLWSGQPWLGFP